MHPDFSAQRGWYGSCTLCAVFSSFLKTISFILPYSLKSANNHITDAKTMQESFWHRKRITKKPYKPDEIHRRFIGLLELLTWFEQATCSLRVMKLWCTMIGRDTLWYVVLSIFLLQKTDVIHGDMLRYMVIRHDMRCKLQKMLQKSGTNHRNKLGITIHNCQCVGRRSLSP